MPTLPDNDLLVITREAGAGPNERADDFPIRDESGREVGLVRREGPSNVTVYDADGRTVVALRRPPGLLKSRIEVWDGAGEVVGRIVQQNVLGKVRFGLEDARGVALGRIRVESREAWDLSVVDASGAEVGRVTKKWAGLGHGLFTTSDNYVLEIRPGVPTTLRLLLLASAAGIDTALKQAGA